MGDDLPATQAHFNRVSDLAAGPQGGIYLVDNRYPNGSRIRYFTPGGRIRTVAGGNGPGNSGDGGAASQAAVAYPLAIDSGPNGGVYIAEALSSIGTQFSEDRIRFIAAPFPLRSGEDLTVPAADGTEIYVFDKNGRHLRTQHALTGADLLTFGYDSGGRLVEIREVAPSGDPFDDLVTTIERDSAGDPTGIVGPYGARTNLLVDGAGFLQSVANPMGHTHVLASTQGGLLTSYSPPAGGTFTFTYNGLGLLTRDDDPVGGFTKLTRFEDGDNFEIEVETALGRTEVKRVEPDTQGGARRIFTDEAGLETVLDELPGAFSTTESPDGTTIDVARGPDPRLGIAAAIVSEYNVTTSTLDYSRTQSRTASVGVDGALVAQQDAIDVNGAVTTIDFDAANLTYTQETPEGRLLTREIDTQGRVTRLEVDGLEEVRIAYDDRGRLESVAQGQGGEERITNFAYDTAGRLTSLSDALLRPHSFSYDGAGRLTQSDLSGNRSLVFDYDPNGNLAEIGPPGRPSHFVQYTYLDQESAYDPPALDASDWRTRSFYDLDRNVDYVERPDGSEVDFGYDAAGRLSTIVIPRGTISLGYDGSTGHVASMAAPGGEALIFSRDGPFVTGTTWSGTVGGTVTQSYNDDLQVSLESVNGGYSISYLYDDDGLVQQAGSLAVGLDATTGLIASTQLANVDTTLSYNGFAESLGETASVSGNAVYATAFTRDHLGRITQEVETIESVTTTTDFAYDAAGRLEHVFVNSVLARSYSYDGNGNRLSVIDNTAGTTFGSYDDQDRLVGYGTRSYSLDAAGDLVSYTDSATLETTSFAYDALGNLMEVQLPSGSTIGYVVDARGRRIGKKIDGVLVRGWLYQNQLNPVAELSATGQVTSRFVYGTRPNVPDYMVKGGTTYRILSDHLGSVRLVVDSSTGTVAQRLDYDEFGNITQDTNPGFQPFAFAGGVYDADTKLTRFGARDYDAETGRWTTKDPIRFEGGLNLYGYAMADPVNLVDPDGLQALSTADRQDIVNRATAIRAALPGPLARFRPMACAISGVAADCVPVTNPDVTADDLKFAQDVQNYCADLSPAAKPPPTQAPLSGNPAGAYNGNRNVNGVSHSRGPNAPNSQ